MSVQQVGHYAAGDIEILVEHDNTILLELDGFSWDLDPKMTPGGAGLGDLRNRYHKRTAAPEGNWSIDRKFLPTSDKGDLFMQLLQGSGYILTEYVAPAAGTHTTAEVLVSILHVRTRTAGVDWVEGVDYTVNYASYTLTFVSTVPAGGLEVKYLTTAAHLLDTNKIQNGGFEDALTNIWEGVATGDPSQDAVNLYVGLYGCKVLVPAQNDGVAHVPDIVVIPGRTYRFRFWIKGTADDTIKAQWTDAGGTSDMTLVSPAGGAIVGADWNEFNFTFSPDEEKVLAINIINSTAAPATFYLDEVFLGDNAAQVNPLDGRTHPFTFNVIVRRRIDQTLVRKFLGCAIYAESGSAGEAWTESISGQFLDMLKG